MPATLFGTSPVLADSAKNPDLTPLTSFKVNLTPFGKFVIIESEYLKFPVFGCVYVHVPVGWLGNPLSGE